MSEMDTTRTITLLRALSLVLSLLAVAGWGAFAYVAASSAEAKQRLNEQVAELKRGQEQLTSEPDQAKAEVVTLRASRDQLVADRVDAQAQLAVARDEITMLQEQLEQLQARVSATGSVRAPAPSSSPARSPARSQRTR
jgi:chromosome segregation ATPase